MTAPDISHSRLKELLTYDPDTGVWRWLVDRGAVRKNDVAGTYGSKGYRLIWMDGKNYRANRLAVFYMTGEWPLGQVDHENLIKDDNSWNNLRDSTQSENQMNRPVQKNNKLGVKGVMLSNRGKYIARISKDGTLINLGSFITLESARSARDEAAVELHGKFARIK